MVNFTKTTYGLNKKSLYLAALVKILRKMKKTHFLTSACRYCRHYQPEGRRGGSCQILGVPVESSWKACVLAAPAFETTLTNIEKSLEDILYLETSLTLKSFPQASARLVDNCEQKTQSAAEKSPAI